MIENHGVIYRLGLTSDTINEISHALIVCGKTALAADVLSNTIYDKAAAAQVVANTIQKFRNQAVAAQAAQTKETSEPTAEA